MTTHRISLTDEELKWIRQALHSAAKAGRQSPERRLFLERLAHRLLEIRPGNPNLIQRGEIR